MRTKIVILGSTGSIGEAALQVASHLASEIQVVGVVARSRLTRLAEQAARYGCAWAACAEPDDTGRLSAALPPGCRALGGMDAICQAVGAPDVDLVLCAIVGTAGLEPVLAAIRAGKRIALASKEILVLAGGLVMAEARGCGVRILPVDSEHSALFQCLEGRRPADVRRLILTASGGPFRLTPAAELSRITPAQALTHPTWNMGAKVTIDSATLMNKGLELIEAYWLFGLPAERLDVVVHPQSLVHGMVELVDGGVLAHLATPDMRLPIQYALTWPARNISPIDPVDFGRLSRLDFELPDHARFPALTLARRALAAGGTMPAVLNAANEVAVQRFCTGALSFPGIWRSVEQVMALHRVVPSPSLAEIQAVDAWARREAERVIESHRL